ncbi:hypothetical protein GF412_03255 [Candidatus Micrarchaeota archaeon]|nr:hypothetical protein [Candidatus Micrarchaeota archaeon]MBD3417971.1 hypothetical protein [Candidatus Micrarchaeota archaeon]
MDKKVIKQGYAEIKVKVSGMIQKHKFELKKEGSAFGDYYLLETDQPIIIVELMRVANEIDLPIRAPTGFFFPQGKTPKDFLVKA